VVVVPIGGPSVFDVYPLLKRVMDIILALIGLAIFLLMLPFIALAIKLDSSGPIFYMQERTGKAGKPFRVIKLRTMVQDAEKRSGPLWAAKGDPRITTVGRFLRKSRLDEVPQIINVLRGEMSMVGPRPERPKFVEMLSEEIPFYNTRHVIRPGVTGWAQVKYRYGSSTYDSMVKLQYDLYYIRHRSLLLDLLILIRTVRKMLLFQGT
jgi:exopolysaccharide biosynthesis polyprenyl glycosylphosphotransferase